LSDLAREVAAGRARADHDDVKGARRCDHVPASLLQIHDDLEEVLQVSRQGGVVRVAARGQVRRRDQRRGAVHDHVRRDQAFAVHDARPLWDLLTGLRDDREPYAARDRLLDLLPAILPDLRGRLRAGPPYALRVGAERDLSGGLVPGEADRLKGLRGMLKFLVEVDAARQELRQILRNPAATILKAGFYLFEWRRRFAIAKREQAFIRREPSFAFMSWARPDFIGVVSFLLTVYSVLDSEV